jgi:hypothetical protein
MPDNDEIARLLRIRDHLSEQSILLIAQSRQLIRESRALRKEIEKSAWDAMGRNRQHKVPGFIDYSARVAAPRPATANLLPGTFGSCDQNLLGFPPI